MVIGREREKAMMIGGIIGMLCICCGLGYMYDVGFFCNGRVGICITSGRFVVGGLVILLLYGDRYFGCLI